VVAEDKLIADLSRLHAVGKVDLPEIAYIYSRLNREVAGTSYGEGKYSGGKTFSYGDSSAFDDGFSTEGAVDSESGSAEAQQAWSALRNKLQDGLGQSANHVMEAARAVLAIANTYETQDTEAAAAVRSAWANGEPNDVKIDYKEIKRNKDGSYKAPDPLPTTPEPVILSKDNP
jgi:hypothetical protein